MPKRTDIKKILIIGSGPIVIGQGCEFDYAGTQACRALKKHGYKVILVNSNPATIMTDPQIADKTYIESIDCKTITKIIEAERPDAVLPTMGGQTALNCVLELDKSNVISKYNIEIIGASIESIKKAEDRSEFRDIMVKNNLSIPKAYIATSLEEALDYKNNLNFPIVIRPSFTLGGTGGGIAYNLSEFINICSVGLELSPKNQILIDESLLGWKEFELEVVRDTNDNCIVICSIENIEPMGVHTGDSITVAPQQTLTDKEYQQMRSAAIKVLREIGIATGGANVQFAVDPNSGRQVVIEMNPRVSRSSTLASKATGFPIAKVAALLAVGYTLDELRNEITGNYIPISFEPTLDYVVTKIPRFNFAKFDAVDSLTTQMKSVGEVMSIGQNFKASLQKALIGLEEGLSGLDETEIFINNYNNADTVKFISKPTSKRILHVADALRMGLSVYEINKHTKIDKWFLNQIKEIIDIESTLKQDGMLAMSKELLLSLKKIGFSDARIAKLINKNPEYIREYRKNYDILPAYKNIDSCAAEFPATTSYLYSTYQSYCESKPKNTKKVIVIGSGPNRIGQGIEFDYSCVQAVLALKKLGFQAILVNCNPDTVSTDYDISDKLYFEPLTIENVLDIVEKEQPLGVMVQFGGQTSLKLANALQKYGVNLIGTPYDQIDLAEDRIKFAKHIDSLDIQQPESGAANSKENALKLANKIGYPVIVRPSFVIGGSLIRVLPDDFSLIEYLDNYPEDKLNLLVDKFYVDATEIEVDLLVDNNNDVLFLGLIEHIDKAGIHSGDSICSMQPYSVSDRVLEKVKTISKKIATNFNVLGIINIQFVVDKENVYVIEVNPRASRTTPLLSKLRLVNFIELSVKCSLNYKLSDILPSFSEDMYLSSSVSRYGFKFPVFPFGKFDNVVPVLGPEMKSTGETMPIASNIKDAIIKGYNSIGLDLQNISIVFIESDKPSEVKRIIQSLSSLGTEVKYILFSSADSEINTAYFEYEKIIKEKIDSKAKCISIYNKYEPNLFISFANIIDKTDSTTLRSVAVSLNIPMVLNINQLKLFSTAINELAISEAKEKVYI